MIHEPVARDESARLAAEGWRLAALGDLASAERCYEAALAKVPLRFEALHGAGLVALARGDLERAQARLSAAAELAPDSPENRYALGRLHRARGELGPAIEHYKEACRLRPGYVEALVSLGIAYRRLGEPRAALPPLRRALALAPHSREARRVLAAACLEADDAAAAIGLLEPLADGVLDDAGECLTLGLALRQAARTAQACTLLERASRRYPESFELKLAWGDCLKDLDCGVEARSTLEAASLLEPRAPQPHARLQILAEEEGDFERALFHARAALECDPGNAGCVSNVGVELYLLQRPREALEWFERAIEMAPEYYPVRLWLAFAHLKLGEFEPGWAAFEWRFHGSDDLRRARILLDRPRWQGEALANRRILLHAEQGMGDAIQFLRYAPKVAARGARVSLLVPAPLRRLAERVEAVERVLCFGDPAPEFDLHCPLMSLPFVFRTRLHDIPSRVPYLAADMRAVRAWRERLRPTPKKRIGIVWAGDPRPGQRGATVTDRRRSLPLSSLAPLAEVPDIEWFSLQKGAGAAQAADPPPGMALRDYTEELHDFLDTAALVEQMDLVISVDTAPAHLAAALGKPVWLLSRFDGCWRWLAGRRDSPWYPTMRIFSQPHPGDWASAVREVANALEGL